MLKYILLKFPLVFFFVISFSISHAQRLPKYENLYKEAMAADDKAYAYSLFTAFSDENPTSGRANLYFQIAMLAYDLSQNIDPIAQYDDFITFSNSSEANFELTLKFLNDTELKKDADLFNRVSADGEKPTVSAITSFIQDKLNDIREQKTNTAEIRKAYYGLVKNYIDCQELYKDICDTYVSIKDIYLRAEQRDLKKIADIIDEEYYDSVQYYLALYKNLLEKHPINGYNNVDVKIEDIKVFRVDGISVADFRQPQTVIWDYKKWSEEFAENQNRFWPVYLEVIEAGDEITERIDVFNSNRALSDNYVAYEVEDDILDSLNALAYYPSLNRYIAYKEEKLNFLTISRRRINSADYDNNGRLGMKDKLYYYDRLRTAYDKLEQMRQDLETYAEADDEVGFVSMNFKNKDDFEDYLSGEKLENETEMANSFDNLKNYYIKKENNIRRTNYITHKRDNIPLFLGNGFYRSTQPQTYITKCIEPAENGFYIAGSYISKEGFATAYTALCSADSSTVVWLKTVDIGRVMYDNCVTALYPAFDGGCFVLIIAKSVSDPELMYSTVIRYNAKGNEVKRLTLPEKTLGIGRYIRYDDVNEQLVMAFYGKEEFWFTPDSKLVIQKIKLDNTILTQGEMKLNGEIVEIFQTKDNGLLIIGNYHSVVDETNNEHRLKSEGIALQSNIFAALFSPGGNFKKLHRLPIDDGTGYAVAALKISDNLINIVGQKGWARRDPAVPLIPGDLIYMSVNAEGNLLFSNQKVNAQ